ncbi:MAG: hypothetical protein V4726_02310 [Verrucomicrobiota bacterium]
MNFSTLAHRLGIAAPASALLWKARRLLGEFPVENAPDLEAWLVELANSRGFSAIQRRAVTLPSELVEGRFSNTELAVALMHPSLADEPQLLRLSAQIISRGVVDADGIVRLAKRESASRVVLALARQALKAAPAHAGWLSIADQLACETPLRENVIHWTRLAEPVMKPRGPHSGEWRLVA